MSEKGLNRKMLDKIAKEVMRLEDQEQIDDFVNMYVYSILLN